MKHLRFDLYGYNEKFTPAKQLKRLGIKYKYWVPQTMGDQIWLLDCEDLPEELPYYLNYKDVPQDHNQWVGWGINKEVAEDLNSRTNTNKT